MQYKFFHAALFDWYTDDYIKKKSCAEHIFPHCLSSIMRGCLAVLVIGKRKYDLTSTGMRAREKKKEREKQTH